MEVLESEQLKELNLKLRNKMNEENKDIGKKIDKIKKRVKITEDIKKLNSNVKRDVGKEAKKIIEVKKEDKEETTETKTEKSEEKKEVKGKKNLTKKEKPKPKKDFAVVNIANIPISTKYATAICKFIKNKKINDAVSDLQQVLMHKKAIPMKGEIPHKKAVKGVGSGAGKYPKIAVENFMKLLRSLAANANVNGLENPIIKEAIANIGSKPYGKFGTIRRKRTHVKIIVKDKKFLNKKNKEQKE